MSKNMKLQYQENPARRSWVYKLSDTLSDSDFMNQLQSGYFNQMPGAIRSENAIMGAGVYKGAYIHGRGLFAWVCNRNGGDPLDRGALTKWYSKSITATSGSTSTIVCAAATFVENEERYNTVYILDDAGAAGAAPEGESAVVWKNSTTTLSIQTPETDGEFTVAVAVGDTARIRSRCQVIAAAIGDQRDEIAGIVMAESLADNYWGWVCIQAKWVGALVKAATAMTEDKALIADTGRLSISNTSGQDLILGYATVGCSGDIASDFIPVSFDADSLCATSA